MSAGYVMALHAERRGWSLATQLDLALRYINNQDDDGTFQDFLARVAVSERGNMVYVEVRRGVWQLVDEAEADVSESDRDWLVVVYDGLDLAIEAWVIEARDHRTALEEATAETKRMPDAADWTAMLLINGPTEGKLWLVVAYRGEWPDKIFAVEADNTNEADSMVYPLVSRDHSLHIIIPIERA